MFSGKKPDCIKCGFIKVIPENYEVIELIDIYQSCFVDGNGGINPQGIDSVLEWKEMKKDESIIQKILIYTIVSRKKQSEAANYGQENTARIRNQGQGVVPNKSGRRKRK